MRSDWPVTTVKGWAGAEYPVQIPPTKESAPCCVAHRDALGRLPLGYCGPDCVRRP